MSHRTILDATSEGLKQRLAKIEQDVADLHRDQSWQYDPPEVSGGASPWIVVAAQNAPDRWKALAGDYICDGTNDDAVVAAAAAAAGIDTILLSPGSFVFDGAGVRLENRSLRGAGEWATTIQVTGITAVDVNNGSVEHIRFQQSGAGAVGVFARAEAIVRSCSFVGFDTAATAGDGSIFEGCFFTFFGVGIDVSGSAVMISSCLFDGSGHGDETAVKSTNSTTALTVTGCTFRGFTSSGAYAGQVFDLQSCSHFVVSDNVFVDCNDYALVRAVGTTGGQFANNSAQWPFLIDLSGTDGLSVLDNVCPVQSGTCTIRTDWDTYPVIRGNFLGGDSSTIDIGVSTWKAIVAANFLYTGAGGFTDAGTGTMRPTGGNFSDGGVW